MSTVNEAVKFETLPCAGLVPNAYNPNTMSHDEFGSLVNEVKRLGRIPKPIVVRRTDEGYTIVDGEHNWRAATAAGLLEVPCEVVDADEFEARRLTFMRNQHGQHCPVREGQMFQQMMELRGISRRRLACELGVSEGYVRKMLAYAEAARLRTAYAVDGRYDGIEGLTHGQLNLYLRLPAHIRDVWMDAGADPELFATALGFDGRDPVTAAQAIVAASLERFVTSGGHGFCTSFLWALAYADWLADHADLRNAASYAMPPFHLELPPFALAMLPCRAEGGEAVAVLTSDEWRRLLQRAVKGAACPDEVPTRIQAGVVACLRRNKVDLLNIGGPDIIKQLAQLQAAPEVVREADYLTLNEKAWLAVQASDGPADLVVEAKRLACERVRLHRRGRRPQGSYYLSEEVASAFYACACEVIRAAGISADEDHED